MGERLRDNSYECNEGEGEGTLWSRVGFDCPFECVTNTNSCLGHVYIESVVAGHLADLCMYMYRELFGMLCTFDLHLILIDLQYNNRIEDYWIIIVICIFVYTVHIYIYIYIYLCVIDKLL